MMDSALKQYFRLVTKLQHKLGINEEQAKNLLKHASNIMTRNRIKHTIKNLMTYALIVHEKSHYGRTRSDLI